MPTRKQMEKLADSAAFGRDPPRPPAIGPADEVPAEYWHSIMEDAAAEAGPRHSIRTQRLSEIQRHLLRVACRRCGRTVEIQMADAVRLYGAEAEWKTVGQRLLDNTCQQRTGRYEEDGCWPSYDAR